ncbi:serine/threonine-protein kinase HipA [Arcanobacterium wilhelmae]|uniref:Serine/threonine-protein kinase HipA n=1 Tax=Arcanobacterium wilhelmae TaxID=1803177 RepID=A0ABT9ND59_9ACTO|nr:type II toxin-antitoxin system HipA family toxin [Arcanobacterium wilhelmae]MDP9801126.1 serine/threonine-protein kinase HipA [Arcanobacterium wilhelmae]
MNHYEVCEGNTVVGDAYFTRSRHSISTTFLYRPDYLANATLAIDPTLPLVTGAQYTPGLPGAFADSAPDRWGRHLVDKAERAKAREEKRSPRTLDELDYLLGVSDDVRQGSLRFREPGKAFLGPNSTVPPLIELPKLLHAAQSVDSDDSIAAIKFLLDTGTTGLGGARPKAAIQMEDGTLALAKFPYHSDSWDVMAWEALALTLMENAGIRVPTFQLVEVGEAHALVLQRFDRAFSARIGYLSVMSALGAHDGDHRDYLDIADAIRDLSVVPHLDLHELYTRLAFFVAIGNTDDHLRNHGFLHTDDLSKRDGWTLSPAFDVNPNPAPGARRATTILGADSAPDEAQALREFGSACDLDADTARDIVRSVFAAVQVWEVAATQLGIHSSERNEFREMFVGRADALREAFGL